jgi:hypothetical protein
MIISNDGRTVVTGDVTFKIDAIFESAEMLINGNSAKFPMDYLFRTEYGGILSLAKEQWELFRKYN